MRSAQGCGVVNVVQIVTESRARHFYLSLHMMRGTEEKNVRMCPPAV